MKHIRLFVEYLIIINLFTNCSASTETRYNDDKPKDKNSSKLVEDFDITPYKTDIEIINLVESSNGLIDAWYDYDYATDDFIHPERRKITGTRDGYRLLILATDNLEEANSIREKLYSQSKRHNVYISFEPPFYKVKLGDFINLDETNDLKFKLNQLGYREARVVQETINLFEE